MQDQLILTFGVTTWACAIWTLLPKAFSLHLRQNKRTAKALKPMDRSAWKTGALATVSLLVLVLFRIVEN